MISRFLLSVGNFFASIHFFLVIFVAAPYLATLMPADQVGLVISGGALVTITSFLLMPKLVRRCGPRNLALVLSILLICVFTGLFLFPTLPLAIVLVALATGTSPLIAYQLDLLLEASTHTDEETGRLRTSFITAANIALIGVPLIIGVLVGVHMQYERVFLMAALSLLPFILLLALHPFPENRDAHLHQLRTAASCLMKDRDLRAVMSASFLLHLFFYLAPIYIPLYLNTILGIPWSELGWIFALMLIPFVVLEYPAGWLADNKWGDRELMAFGFLLMGLFFGAIAFIGSSTSLTIIVSILVFTRIGGALVEAMVEGHFFRRITARDTSSIAVFRLTRPLAMLLAPLLGTLLLFWGSYALFFILSGIVLLVAGITSAFFIKDVD